MFEWLEQEETLDPNQKSPGKHECLFCFINLLLKLGHDDAC